ncbi:phosphatidate cytidylyltransferase [Mycoplasma crocodyli]|uniref:Phosphatidate cytidylyltransferase n=1 Tax=Mycoplasma crocodyli (strain ATCC 51981 / MP145) TaxID=512564 RepID=D5E4L6_MYCCM|nr:phosphatidate cytidylyltransferase [Mycoplasma crocodyli]ADE19873.1 phosphatidate cytidylyltransferase [Mycoplasma crocodyli MP145]
MLNFEKIKNNRIIPAILLAVFFGGFFSFMIIGGNSQGKFGEISRLISYIMLSIIFIYICFELFNSFGLGLYYSLFLSCLCSVAFAFPMITISNFIDYEIDAGTSYGMKNIIELIFRDFWSVIIMFLISLSYFFIKIFTVENVSYKNLTIKATVLFITLYFLMIASKQLIYSSTSAWKYLILFFAVSISCDMFGYFGGKYFGHKFFKNKFAPSISPKKTWEGAISAYLMSFIILSSTIFTLNLFNSNIGIQIFANITLPMFAIMGDLSFSAIKRMNSTKDFSKILLGHGGILDRYDSISFVFFFGFLMYFVA